MTITTPRLEADLFSSQVMDGNQTVRLQSMPFDSPRELGMTDRETPAKHNLRMSLQGENNLQGSQTSRLSIFQTPGKQIGKLFSKSNQSESLSATANKREIQDHSRRQEQSFVITEDEAPEDSNTVIQQLMGQVSQKVSENAQLKSKLEKLQTDYNQLLKQNNGQKDEINDL